MNQDPVLLLFEGAAETHLQQLECWWPLGRRPHVDAIREQIKQGSKHWHSLLAERQSLGNKLQQQEAALVESRENIAKIEGAFADLDHRSAKASLAAVAREVELNQRYGAEQMAREQLTTTLIDAQNRLKTQSMHHAATQAALESEQEQRRLLDGDMDRLEAEHAATQIRFQLVSRLLAVPPPRNEGLESFQKLLDDDYMRFASAEASLADEATALLLLQSIQQELHLMAANPDIFRRTMVGVVGGFSSGKSAFINSFLGGDFRLLSAVTPATVIPSYVYPADTTRIQAYSFNGGCIELDPCFYREMSRAFVEQFSFDLKRIMPLISVGTAMDTSRTGNICLIDTPGYNPGIDGTFSESDRAVAVSHSRKSDVLFWVIGIDANGTIPQSDIDFLADIGFEGRPVYVVLNKADLKPPNDIDDILDLIEDEIASHSIDVVGISAYSSRLRKEVAFRRKPLQKFLDDLPTARPPVTHVADRLDEIFDLYDHALGDALEQAKACRSAARALVLNLMQVEAQDAQGMADALKKEKVIKDAMNPELLSRLLEEVKRIRSAFQDAVRKVVTPD